MSSAGKPGNGLWILALSAVVGFGAVYLTLGRRDNAASMQTGAESPAKSEASVNPGAGAKPGAGANTGQMAAFLVKKSPEAIADITFNDASGKAITLSSFKGRTVLLNLWATWCAPCREEMPSLDRLQQALGSDKFEVVALSLDRGGAEASRKFLAEVKATTLKLYVDPAAKQGTALKLVGMPTTILIDKDGREVGRLAGTAEWDSPDAKKLIAAAMK